MMSPQEGGALIGCVMTQIDPSSTALPPPPGRASGLERLRAFTPDMGGRYAARRNHDFGPQDRSNVACLSPHVRHRLILEEELARAAIDAHGLKGSEKFVQEVCWRTYWKGWLAMRPSYWMQYRTQLGRDLDAIQKDGAMRARYEAAIAGETGVEPFDDWTRELLQTGWLHNHARMWFASIWIFTLNLPWTLGADVFLRHLMDGDPASNTLSWRWIAGLQTANKTYLARASNINKFTGGRYQMQGYDLAAEAPPLVEDIRHPDPVPPKPQDPLERSEPVALLLTDEDLRPQSWGVDGLDIRAVLAVDSLDARSPLAPGAAAAAFTSGAIEDALSAARTDFGVPAERTGNVADAARKAAAAGARQLVMMRAHPGPMGDLVDAARAEIAKDGVRLVERTRPWDEAFYPHATKGFFKLKEKIPAVLSRLGIA